MNESNELRELLAALVAIDSVNPALVSGGAGETQIAQFIADWGYQNGLQVIVQEAAPARPNVILIARGSGGGKSLMFNAHTDTVGTAEMHAPLKPAIKDGRMFGRGSYDMKSGLAASMLALKHAQTLPLAGDVILSAVVDEEYASIGTQALIREWQRWQADAAVITEPTELEISIAHKGFVWLDIEVFGKSAHGSRPQLGIDAIAKIGEVLLRTAELDRRLRARPSHDLLHSGSIHASTIHGGEENSMIPAYCKLVVERRTLPHESADDVQAELQSILDDIAAADPDFKARLTTTLARQPFAIAPEHPLVQSLKRHAEAQLQTPVPLVGSSFWMDAALFAQAGIPTAALGPKGTGAHARVEWVDLASVQHCRAIYCRLLSEFCR